MSNRQTVTPEQEEHQREFMDKMKESFINLREEAMSTPRKVVCAALRNSVGDIICGVRHYDLLMHQQIQMRIDYMSWKGAEQGFVDATGKFLTREEAMIQAKAAGQEIDIKRGCGGDPDTLYSEGLY